MVHGSIAAVLVAAVAIGCGPRIEQEPPIPEHRIETCETWCGMMFDPACPEVQRVEVETEAECFDSCAAHDNPTWGWNGKDEDVCAETKIPYVECLAALSCEERRGHFDDSNQGVAYEERSSCGALMRPHFECLLRDQ